MARMTAKFPGRCVECKGEIKPGVEIDYDRTTRKATCATCAPVALPAAPPVVHVTIAGADSAAFKVAGRLGTEAFAIYRAALTGARYADGVNTLPMSLVGRAIAALHQPGFGGFGVAISIAEEVKAAVDALERGAKLAIAGAEERTAAVDAVLAAKGGALYPYQREGVAWLAQRVGALVADDMGLGKTIQALTAIPAGAPVVVVCPAVAKSVWRSEAEKWRPDLRVTVLSGRGSFGAPAAGEIVCINYDILGDELPALLPGTVVVLDEAHAVANSKAARTKRVRALSAAARASGGRCWALTATPLKNRPTELWSVLEAAGLAREAFGSWKAFVRAFNGREGSFGGYEWGNPSDEVPALLQRVSLRRRKADVLADLPAKTYRVLPAEIDKATAKLCDEAIAKLTTAKGGQLDLGLLESAVEKLAKSSLGFKELSAARAAIAKAKIPAMLELVEQHEAEDVPLVVFSAYRAPIDLLAAREGWAAITGDTSDEERGRIVERFQGGELRGVACTIRAGGVAITLTRASNVLRVDREWNPALNGQAEDRCYRIGQKSAVLVTDLVADHVLDQRIADVLAAKQALIGASVEAATVQHVAPDSAPEIDWAAIEAEAAIAVREAEEARKAAEAAADQRAKKLAETRIQNARNAARVRVRAAAARRLGEAEAEEDAPRRGPKTELEIWALEGLRQLASDDPDRAKEKNGVGFNASDGGIGHALAWLGELTEQEWRLAVRIAWHYPAQIGRPAEAA